MFNWQTMYLRQKTAELVGGKIVRENFVKFVKSDGDDNGIFPFDKNSLSQKKFTSSSGFSWNTIL